MEAWSAADWTQGCFTSARCQQHPDPTCQKFHLFHFVFRWGERVFDVEDGEARSGEDRAAPTKLKPEEGGSSSGFSCQMPRLCHDSRCDPALPRCYQSYLALSRLLCSLRMWTCWHPAPHSPPAIHLPRQGAETHIWSCFSKHQQALSGSQNHFFKGIAKN